MRLHFTLSPYPATPGWPPHPVTLPCHPGWSLHPVTYPATPGWSLHPVTSPCHHKVITSLCHITLPQQGDHFTLSPRMITSPCHPGAITSPFHHSIKSLFLYCAVTSPCHPRVITSPCHITLPPRVITSPCTSPCHPRVITSLCHPTLSPQGDHFTLSPHPAISGWPLHPVTPPCHPSPQYTHSIYRYTSCGIHACKHGIIIYAYRQICIFIVYFFYSFVNNKTFFWIKFDRFVVN